jgi:predicted nucleic acid-binding protein
MVVYNKDPMEVYLWDASALVKVFINEKGSGEAKKLFHSLNVSHWVTEHTKAEILGILKRKWLKGKLNDDGYFGSIVSVYDYYRKLHICSVSLENYNYLKNAISIIEKYNNIDLIDAAPIVGISHGIYSTFDYESGSYLITADNDLAAVAQEYKIKVKNLNDYE